MFNLKQLAYRAYLLTRGKRKWHWRYYGPDYRAVRTEQGYHVLFQGKAYACSIPKPVSRQRPLAILCSGPSIKSITNPKRLFQLSTLVVNGAHRLYQGDDPVFDYYLVSDIGFIRRNWDSFVRGAAVSRTLLLDHRALKSVLERSDAPLKGKEVMVFNLTKRPFGTPIPHCNNAPDAGFYCDNGIVFSINPDRGFFASNTVAYLGLQLGVSLGYKDINFFGLDLGGAQRFYSDSENEKSMIDDDYEQYIEPHFKFASRICRSLDVELKNGSPVSKLPSSIIAKQEPNKLMESLLQ